MIRRCTNYHCRTSLDEHPIECPHGLPFCEHCVWEEGCDECVIEPLRQRAAAAWDAAAVPGPYIDPARDAWVDQAAELRAEERAYELAQLEDREEMRSA